MSSYLSLYISWKRNCVLKCNEKLFQGKGRTKSVLKIVWGAATPQWTPEMDPKQGKVLFVISPYGIKLWPLSDGIRPLLVSDFSKATAEKGPFHDHITSCQPKICFDFKNRLRFSVSKELACSNFHFHQQGGASSLNCVIQLNYFYIINKGSCYV